METDVVVKHQAVNSCCFALKEKYSKLEASRNALRQGVKIQNELIDKLQNENLNLKKAYEKEKVQVDAEKPDKVDESAIRVSLENEISALKSEILSLQGKVGSQAQEVDGEVMVLRTRVSELETEIDRLKELVVMERNKADSERRKAEAEKKKANEAQKNMKSEKSRADEEERLADIERKKVAETQIQLEKLKGEVDEARLKLASEVLKCEEANKLLEGERQKVVMEKRRADAEMAKAEEQRKLAEITQKKADSERRNAEAEKRKANEALKLMKSEKSRADEERRLADIEREKVAESRIQLEKLKSEIDEARLKLASEVLKFEEANKFLEAERQKVIMEKKRADSEMAKTEEQRKLAEITQKKADTEKRKAEAEKRKANEAQKIMKSEKNRADEERRLADIEREKVAETQIQLEKLKGELDEARSKLASEVLKSEECKKLLEAERQKVVMEKKISDSEMAKAEEQRKLAEITQKKATDEKSRADSMTQHLGETEARSKLASEALCEEGQEAYKLLEAERQKVLEKKDADSEMAKAEERRKLVEIIQKKAMDEKSRADSLSQQLDEHRQRIEKLQKQRDELASLNADLSDKHMKAETAKVKGGLQSDILDKGTKESKLVLGYLESEEANKRLKGEKQRVTREKKRVDVEMRRAEEQRKMAEASNKKAMEEKHRADQLAWQLEDNTKKIEELRKEISDLVSSRTLVEGPLILPEVNTSSGTTEIKLLRKQLKLKKEQLKHAKEVARLEAGRNNIMQRELCFIRQEFGQSLQRLDVLTSCFSHQAGSRDDKAGDFLNSSSRKELFGSEPQQMHLHCSNELLKPSCTAVGASDCVKQTMEGDAPLPYTGGGNCSKCISGIDSKLEPLLRGSNRKMLQSSAINSSMASFSDRLLVGSQERGAFSVTASAKLPEEKSNSQPKISSLSAEVTKMRCNENLAVVAENSVQSPISIHAVGKAGHSKKRKRIFDAVKSIEHLYSEGKKWHLQLEEKLSLLHCSLSSQTDGSLLVDRCVVPNLEGCCDRQVGPHKKIKASPEKEVALQRLRDSSKREDRLGNRGVEGANIHNRTPPPANDIRRTALSCKVIMGDSGESHQEDLDVFNELLDGNYMKLLSMDNAVDEDRYRRAIEMPLSPTLPVIDITKHLVDESCYEELSRVKDILVPSCNFNLINAEMDPNKLEANTSERSHVLSKYKNEGPVYPLENVTANENGGDSTVCEENAPAKKMWDSSADFGLSEISCCVLKETNNLWQSTPGLDHNELPGYCVVFSNTEHSSILRIFRAARTFMAQSVTFAMDQVMQNIMPSLFETEDLSMMEKACVLFSVLLYHFSRMASHDGGNCWRTNSTLLFDSFAGCLNTVMSNVETRSFFTELCISGELLTLIEDFLLDGRVLFYGYVSSEPLPTSDSRIDASLDQAEVILSHRMASPQQIVAGAFMLASMCVTIDHIGFLCEASYNILRTQKLGTGSVLNVLHVFVYVCGSKYFILQDYSLIMTVTKSLVTFLERGNSFSDLTCCVASSAGVMRPEFTKCTECPFLVGAVSMDDVVSLLFEKLQTYTLHGAGCLDSTESANELNSGALFRNGKNNSVSSHEGAFGFPSLNSSSSSCLQKFGMSTESNSIYDEKLCHLTDVFSLVELVACNMSWDWNCNNIISHMVKLLELSVTEKFAIVTVILLGKLGRLGIGVNGYEDKGVEDLKSSLSALLCQNSSRKFGLPFQIAIVNAILNVLPGDFEELIMSSVELPPGVSQSDSAGCIKKWYSTLSSEQQSLSLALLRSAGEKSCKTG